MTDATDARLAAQYEAYPYPQRDPKDEKKRLIVGSPGSGVFWIPLSPEGEKEVHAKLPSAQPTAPALK